VPGDRRSYRDHLIFVNWLIDGSTFSGLEGGGCCVFKPIQPATEARLSKECQQDISIILRQRLIRKSHFCEIKRE